MFVSAAKPNHFGGICLRKASFGNYLKRKGKLTLFSTAIFMGSSYSYDMVTNIAPGLNNLKCILCSPVSHQSISVAEDTL